MKRKGGNIEVTATSDSTAAIVEYYERTTMAANSVSGEQTSESDRTSLESRSNPLKTYLLGAMCGAVIILLIIIILKHKRQ